jgi:hypothetical protein
VDSSTDFTSLTGGLTQTTFETSISSTKSGYALPPVETYEGQADKVKRGMVRFYDVDWNTKEQNLTTPADGYVVHVRAKHRIG